MPRLYPPFTDAVFFLYEKDPNGNGYEVLPDAQGSGVIVGIYDFMAAGGKGVTHYYAVTAAHVARSGASVVRINTRDGKSRFIDFDPSEWSADLDWEDVAAVDITEYIRKIPNGDKISYISPDLFVTQEFIDAIEFGIGEDGFMLGLFTAQPGKTRNLIAARFGNVSLLADEASPITRQSKSLGKTFTTPCHVFDMHSRPGFSGSPVFVYRTPDGDLRNLEVNGARKQMIIPHRTVKDGQTLDIRETVEVIEVDFQNNRFLRLLGIHVSQFQERVGIEKIDEESVPITENDVLNVPGSMTIVVPAWQITKLLSEDRRLRTQRIDRLDRAKSHVSKKVRFVAQE